MVTSSAVDKMVCITSAEGPPSVVDIPQAPGADRIRPPHRGMDFLARFSVNLGLAPIANKRYQAATAEHNW
jgi:hypothetical protein